MRISRSTSWLACLASLVSLPLGAALAHADQHPKTIAVITDYGACDTSNFAYSPASEVYADSGKTFVVEGQSGSTCWNRIDNATSETPTSFAGAAGTWYLLAGADCPADNSAVMREWPMTTDDPIRDVSCVQRPPLVITCRSETHPYDPASWIFVDSGRPYVAGGQTGTTCWNRIDNASSVTPSSFAGLGGEWQLFSAADCPADNTKIMYFAEKTSDDPAQDLECVDFAAPRAVSLKLACEGPSMGMNTKGIYVDSGTRFAASGQQGTTCWNRVRPDAGTRPSSFAGLGGEWLIFSGQGCPPDGSRVIYSAPRSSESPRLDVPCVDQSAD
ncbi:MAG: hypothetical protein AAGC60_14185 [Acidobacteriota bacterium]